MTAPDDYYTVLGLPQSASEQEIKSAYHKKALELHPDRNSSTKDTVMSSDAITKFQQIQAAYEILKDSKTRAEYDRKLILKPHVISEATLNNASVQKILSGSGFFASFTAKRSYTEQTTTIKSDPDLSPPMKKQRTQLPPISDITTRLQKEDGSSSSSGTESSNTYPSSNFLSSSSSNNLQPIHSERAFNLTSLASIGSLTNLSRGIIDLCLQTKMTISFEESVTGCKKSHPFKRMQYCEECMQSGKSVGSFSSSSISCRSCSGTGFLYKQAYVDVTIPAGVLDGCKKRITGEGNISADGKKGDLILTIAVTPHAFFRRINQVDVECDLPISYYHLCVGVTVQIPSIRNTVKVIIFLFHFIVYYFKKNTYFCLNLGYYTSCISTFS